MDKKVTLLNAKTLIPYSIAYKHVVSNRELVPIFYQKSHQKTQDVVNKSLRKIELESEDWEKQNEKQIETLKRKESQTKVTKHTSKKLLNYSELGN
mmetsp:Transcript_398/g.442  ORF Transcript_398/g.442 Transcript_398/m.442 type:complete len:96 (-) Transcript_398:498-785(-)